jgi:hypothetical protein
MSTRLTVGIENIEEKLARRTLPREWPVAAGGDWGEDRPCALCETAVGPDQVEVRARYGARPPLDFHVQCFAGWWRVVSETRRV